MNPERTHPSPSVVSPLQGFVDAGALPVLLLGGAVQLDENLGARLGHLAAGLQGGVGLPLAVPIPPALDRGHLLVFLCLHLGLQPARLLSQLIAHDPEVPGSEEEREISGRR